MVHTNTNLRNDINNYFADKKEIKSVYLYGSVISGKGNLCSDVDVALLTSPCKDSMEGYRARARYAGELARLLARDVDVVFLQEAGELLAFQILKEGEVIFERDKKTNRLFRASRLVQCLDFQFIEKRMQNGMVAAMRRNGVGE